MAQPTESITGPETKLEDCMLGFEDREWDKLPLKYLPCHERKYSYPKTERFQLDPPLQTGKPGDPSKLAKCVMVAQTSGDKLILPTEQEYAREFLTKVAKVIPHTGSREMMVDEFGLFDYEADRVIDKLRVPKRKGGSVNVDVKESWLKEYKRLMSVKLIDYLAMVMSARRTKRTRYIAATLLNHFCDLTGECCSLNNPRNRVQRIQVYIADRFAVWLADTMAKIDKELCEDYLEKAQKDLEKEQQKKDESQRETKEPIRKNEKPRKPSKKKPEEGKKEEDSKKEDDKKKKEGEEVKKHDEEGKKKEGEEVKKHDEEGKKKEGGKVKKPEGDDKKKEGDEAKKPKDEDKKKEGEEVEKPKEEDKKKEGEEAKKPKDEDKKKEGEEVEKPKEEDKKKEGEEAKKPEGEDTKKKSEEVKKPEGEDTKKKSEEVKKPEGDAKKKEEEEAKKTEGEDKKKEGEEVKKPKDGDKKEEVEVKKHDEEDKKKEGEEVKKTEGEDKNKGGEEVKKPEGEDKKKEGEEVKKPKGEDKKKEEEEGKKTEEEAKKKEGEKDKDSKEIQEIEKAKEEEHAEGAGDITHDPMDAIEKLLPDSTPSDTSPTDKHISTVIEGQIKKEIGKDLAPEDEHVVAEISGKLTGLVVDSLEKGKKELSEKPTEAKVTYYITRPKGECYFNVKKIDDRMACAVANSGRLERVAVISESICNTPSSLGPLKSTKEMKEWAKWAANVVELAEKWASWIDRTCNEAETKAKSGKAGNSEWEKFKRTTESRAHELRRNKRYFKESADAWKKKYNQSR
nr:neurofilament medium polypeptide-like [Halyomorpha halys]